jgi:hypothetical protein
MPPFCRLPGNRASSLGFSRRELVDGLCRNILPWIEGRGTDNIHRGLPAGAGRCQVDLCFVHDLRMRRDTGNFDCYCRFAVEILLAELLSQQDSMAIDSQLA